jgi:hypothetical protein
LDSQITSLKDSSVQEEELKFFKEIITGMVESLMKTDEDLIIDHYQNLKENSPDKSDLLNVLKQTPAIGLNRAFE